ncbi:hydantoinase/carbamoylase family amidase [Aquabacter sediminis]|uniref:hydantoinase/carbamoylase family amidase n=1 Tax=Aquabacter sediminis TaxID=3029197 RepID=UPI00237EC2C0|nr:hydantoinase/carbamoylase family amidase [Aquabacter sp. P-9]MDE1568846.1 hydantoinase/carbamoylase family amidase [Aquabacter sp. P-9]
MSGRAQLAADLFEEIRALSDDGVGVTREAYGAGEEAAMQAVERWAAAFGFTAARDRYQNLWLRLPEDNRAEPPIVIGSHLDSVPQGGNFDGLAGVIAGLLVLKDLKGRARQVPPVRVLALRGEESAWYGKAYTGSLALTGQLPASALALRHRSGTGTLGEAMARSGVDVDAVGRGEALVGPADMAAWLELHIEQGPVMIARQWPAAVVTGIRGNIRHTTVTCQGEAGHSGAVPRWLRKDAVLAVADLLSRLDEHWRVLLQMGMDLVMTVGILATSPKSHAVSVIPGEARFSFEVRSQDKDTLERFYELMLQECQTVGQARGVSFSFDERLISAPATMDRGWIERLEAAGHVLGHPVERMPSGAGHDAAVFANAGIPSAMVFVRNANGSHNPSEAMEIKDFLAGVDLLSAAVTSTPPAA